MEKLMALQKYVRQLRPIQEKYTNHVEQVQTYLTESDTEQDLVEKTISVEYNKLKGSSDPIADALLNAAEYSKIKPNLVEQGKRVAQQLHKNHSQIGILKHLGRGNATNNYGKLYGVSANDTTPKTDIGDGGAYNLSLKEAAGAQLMSPKGAESTGLVQSAVDRYTSSGGKVDATKALSLLNEELDSLAVKEMVLTVGGGKIKGAKDAFQDWYFNKSDRRSIITKVEKNRKKQDEHMKAELSVHKITKVNRKYKDKLIKGVSALSQNELRNKYFKQFIGSEYSVKGFVIPDKYLKTDNEKELVKDNKRLQEKVVEILDIAIRQTKFLSSLANEFTKNDEFTKYVIYEAASGHAKFTGDVKSAPPYTGKETAVAKKIMTYDKNTGAVELEDIWKWSKKSGGLLVDSLSIDFKSSRTSRAGYTKFAVSIGKKVISLLNDYQMGFYNENTQNTYQTLQNIIDEEYLKIYPTLNNIMNELQKLDEGILDYVRKGFKSAKDFTVSVGKKIREVFTKFLKVVFKRFVTMIKELFEKNPNEALKTLGVEYVVSGVRIYK